MQTVQLYINNQRVDLFSDETISLNSSIQNVKDISKIFADYSQTFTIPTSKENNKIFKHYDNSDIVDGYDARFRTTAKIELNNIPFRSGTVRLNKVIRRKGVSYAYDITFFGSTATIIRILGDDKLKDLDNYLSDYNHEWSFNNILQGLNTGIEGNSDPSAIIYPLISPVRKFTYNSDPLYVSADNEVNIGSASTQNGIRPKDLKPAIRLMRVIEAIEAKYPQIQFSRDFFGNSMFNELYLWLHRQAGEILSATGVAERIINDFLLVNETLTCGSNYARFYGSYFDITTGGTLIEGVDAQATITITPNDLNTEYTYKVIDLLTDTLLLEKITSGESTETIDIGISSEPIQDYRIQVQISTKDSTVLTSYDASWNILTYYMVDGNLDCQNAQEYGVISQQMLSSIIVANQMPDVKVIDLLTGIFKMFNLTSYVEDNIIVVKDLNSFYNTYEQYDITDYVDTDEVSVSRMPLYSNINFDYKDPITFLSKEFSDSNGIKFGEEKFNVIINDEYIDGEDYSIQLPFEKVIYERLNDDNDGSLTNAQYGWFVNETQEKVLGSPLIFFNVNTDPGVKAIYFRSFDGVTAGDVITYNRPSNSSSDTLQTLNFGEENDEYSLLFNENSLFKNFYEIYIKSVFNKQNRLTNLTAYLPLNILSKYKLNDRFLVGDRNYIINTIQTNLNSGKSEIEFINVLTDVFIPILLCPSADNDEVTVDSTLYTVDCGDEVCATADSTTVTVDNDSLTVDCGDAIATTTTTTSTTTTSTTTTLATTTAGTTTTTPTTTAGTTTTGGTTTAGTTTTTTEAPCVQRISYSGIPTQSMEVGNNKTINLNSYFNQLDGQPLTYIAIDNTSLLDSVSLSGSQLTMFANTGNVCGTDGSGVYVQASDNIGGNCIYDVYFTVDVFGCTSTSTTTAATTSTSTTTSTTTEGTTTAGTTTTLPTTTTTIAPINPTGTINNTFVGYNNTGANFDVYTIQAVDTFIDFTIYPAGGGSYSERQIVPTVNGTLVNWSISWDGDIYTGAGGTGVANLVATNNLGTESTLDTDSFVIPASGSTTTTTIGPVSPKSFSSTMGLLFQAGTYKLVGYEIPVGSISSTLWADELWTIIRIETIWEDQGPVGSQQTRIIIERQTNSFYPRPFVNVEFISPSQGTNNLSFTSATETVEQFGSTRRVTYFWPNSNMFSIENITINVT